MKETGKRMEEISFNYFYWGPLLFRTKISKQITNKLLKAGRKQKNNDARKDLAGVIEKEYYFSDDIAASFEPHIVKIAHGYLHHFMKNWSPRRAGTSYPLGALQNVKLDNLWINFMQENEFNPSHVHTNCHMSFVLFVKVPKLEKERSKYQGSSAGPGALDFYYGEPNFWVNNGHSFLPEVGELYLFPHNLMHAVIPYKTKGERVSVAGNLSIFDSNNRRMQL